MLNRHFAKNWYLWLFAPDLAQEKIAILDLQDGNECCGEMADAEFVIILVGDGCRDIRRALDPCLAPGNRIRMIHVVLIAGDGIGPWRRFLRAKGFMREISRATGGDVRPFGLDGKWDAPRLVLPLRRHMIRYVTKVAFRGGDGTFKSFLKGWAAILLGPWAWNGSLALACEIRAVGSRCE